MMRQITGWFYLLILFILMLCPAGLWARPVALAEAERAARHWVGLEQVRPDGGRIQTPISFSSIAPLIYRETQTGYLVTLQPQGFILIPDVTELSPLAFVSYAGDFDQVKDHPFLKLVQERLLLTRERLGYGATKTLSAGQPNSGSLDVAQVDRNETSWDLLLRQDLLSQTLGSGEMIPLLSSRWSQWDPFNLFVPKPEAPDPNIPAGCSATAMAQLMYYWKHPSTGRGQHCYTLSPYGQLCADFQNTTYDWANMLDYYGGGESLVQRQAVARLLSHVGIAIDTQYAPPPVSSAANFNANEALSAFFKYSSTAAQVNRAAYATSADWFNVFKEQLDSRLPVLLAVHSITGGANHAVVVDGYRTDNLMNLLHVNLGWGGLSDTYYAVDQIYGEAASILDYALINIYPETFVPDTSLSGTVTGYDGLPIEKVQVQIWKETTPGNFQEISAVMTNPGGFYSVALSPGKYKVYFYAEIANWYLWKNGSSRRFTSEWFDNHGSMNWDMMIDYAEVITLGQGEGKVINGVLEKQCSISALGNPSWMTPISYGEGDYLIAWGVDSYGIRYRLQRATQADYSDAVPLYLALPPPFFFDRKLPQGTYYYRVRKENQCGASLWTTTSLEVPYWSQNWRVYLPLLMN
jgi:hypothetical protein